MSKPPFKLFKYPSRGRPAHFFSSLNSIYENIADKDYFHVSCTLDSDDISMNNQEIIDRINSYENISIEWGKSASKIHAVNRQMPDINWDILICHSDDMRFNTYGFDQMIGVDMLTHFPDFDGILHYPDQDAKQMLATMYIAGRKWWEYRQRYIYHPGYLSVFCDNEEMEVAQKMGKYKYCGYQINIHLNPAYGHRQRDDMFNEQQGHWPHDEKLYNQRKINNFYL